MKIRNIFSLILSSALLFAGCAKENATDSLDTLKLSKTYLALPVEGGSAELTISASEDWAFVINETWPEVVTFAKDENNNTYKAQHDSFGNLTNPAEQIAKKNSSWLVPSVLKGGKGETKVIFDAEETNVGRELDLTIVVGGKRIQHLKVRQGDMSPVEVTCAEANDSPDGRNVRIKGICTRIENFDYGNIDITDETGTIYVYGTLDAEGKSKNFSSMNIEVGDELFVEGPVGSYKGKKQLVNITVIEHKKSLIKSVTEEISLPKTGGEFEVRMAYKGNGVFFDIPEDCDWITYVGMKYVDGIPSKLVPSPADTAVITLSAKPNSDDTRSCKLVFTSSKDSDSSTANCVVTEKSGLAYFEESFATESDKFTIDNVKMNDPLTYVWKWNSSKYMKASAFVSGTAYECESLLISSDIDLTDAEGTVTLTFEHTAKYYNGVDPKELITVVVRESGADTWTTLEGVEYPSGEDWNFISSGDIDLSDYAGKTIQIAFRYASTTVAAPTWEVKNVVVK
ncbi:MAG: choice-of-anchor J domain-containing protein [Candidatus Cryptobacteroides sp.]